MKKRVTMAIKTAKLELPNLLLDEKLVTERQLQRAIQEQQKTNEKLAKVLVRMGFLSEKELTQAIGKQMGVPFVDLESQPLETSVVQNIPEHLARRYKVIPVQLSGKKLTLAMADPLNVLAIDDIRLITGFDIQPAIAVEELIAKFIDQHFGVTDLQEMQETVKTISPAELAVDLETQEEEEKEEIAVDKLKTLVNEAPIIRVVNLIISQAIKSKASDIHIEPASKQIRVRYRIDGVLHDVMNPPKHIQAPMISRIKIMSNLDIAERRIPQDGKIHLRNENKEYDLRVSTMPTIFGEKVVIRVLDKSSVSLGLDKLGFFPEIQEEFEEMISKPYGMILVTGPTGSGKSTTLYSCLHKLNTGDKNIMTIEDPVEYQMNGVNQVQVNEKAGLTFSSALRSFLRQDPNVIMVGEIRDKDTARIAVEAALTGHLVLSTLHTNDAASAVARLTEMEVEPFLTSSTVIGVLAQRLARVICSNCKEPAEIPYDTLRKLGFLKDAAEEINLMRGRGCDECKKSGYRGRVGIYELMPMSDPVRALTLQRASSGEIRKAALEAGMQALQNDAVRKVREGITSLEEMMRVVYTEGQMESS